MKASATDEQLAVLQAQLSREIHAIPSGPARVSARAQWLDAAWHCANVALGKRRAQPGSSRAKARALCARIIEGETVPIDELRSVTTPKSTRQFLSKPQHATKKSARQLDAEIAHALAKPPGSKRPAGDVVKLFEHMADVAEAGGAENLSLGQGSLGYSGDPKEFRFSEIFARRLPSAKHERLLEMIDEYSAHPYRLLGRKLTAKEAEWLRREAKKIYEEERQHIDRALRENR